ncbi:hypothetical protein BMS3Bbin10_01614 [bacterium BMS3Bbin10]|nr:hypothetical protein BMS3Bbin10_01614 [bacterium BMS3Bbin10]
MARLEQKRRAGAGDLASRLLAIPGARRIGGQCHAGNRQRIRQDQRAFVVGGPEIGDRDLERAVLTLLAGTGQLLPDGKIGLLRKRWTWWLAGRSRRGNAGRRDTRLARFGSTLARATSGNLDIAGMTAFFGLRILAVIIDHERTGGRHIAGAHHIHGHSLEPIGHALARLVLQFDRLQGVLTKAIARRPHRALARIAVDGAALPVPVAKRDAARRAAMIACETNRILPRGEVPTAPGVWIIGTFKLVTQDTRSTLLHKPAEVGCSRSRRALRQDHHTGSGKSNVGDLMRLGITGKVKLPAHRSRVKAAV